MSSNSIYTSTKVMPYVYRLDNPTTGEFYIGYRSANKVPSTQDLPNYKTSKSEVRSRFDEFNWIIIAEFFSGADAYDFEQATIHENWKLSGCLNQSCYHETPRFRLDKHSEETKQKMRKPKQPFTAEHRNNMSLTRQGRKLAPRTESHRASISRVHTGMMHSESTKRKISNSKTGVTTGKFACFDIMLRVFVWITSDEFHQNKDRYLGVRSGKIKQYR
jgi:hypothetical protein